MAVKAKPLLWVAAGLGEGADPYEVCDAVTAVVRVALARDWQVAIDYQPTLAPLAAYVAGEMELGPVLVIGSGAKVLNDPAMKTNLDRGNARMTTPPARGRPRAAILIGSPPDTAARQRRMRHATGGLVYCIAGPGGGTARLPLEADQLSNLRTQLAGSQAYPFLARMILDDADRRINMASTVPTPGA